MRRLIRLLSAVVMGLIVLVVVAGAGLIYLLNSYGEGLPDHRQLADYEPPTATRIHAGDGRLLAEYARQNRVFVPSEAIPERLKQAFVAAEDKNFYHHPGIDIVGITRALVSNLQNWGNDRRPEGASTITQQVAKNFLLSSELSYQRKLKEMLLALRMERTFTKDRILELYLNEIFLGNRSYGVAAAALNYFDKSLDELSIGEAALLAGLPKAPSSYDPVDNPDAARQRRDYVIGRMQDDGYITAAQAATARAEPVAVRPRSATQTADADFFIEEVRRQLVARLGEQGFYEGGLSVRVTLSSTLQATADQALRRGLANYDRRQGWRGPWGQMDLAAAGDGWQDRLDAQDPGFELGTWQRGVVLRAKGGHVELGLDDGQHIELGADDVAWTKRQPLAPGDLVVVEQVQGAEESHWVLRQRPSVEGAVVALDPHTGRVLAMSGGFSYRQSKFNRATQARRQPGSAFKPFVYLAGLESGMTPASIVLDAPISLDQGLGCRAGSPRTTATISSARSRCAFGLERSRNLISVRVAQKVGMDKVMDVASRFGHRRPDAAQPRRSAGLERGDADRARRRLCHAGQRRQADRAGAGRADPGSARPHHHARRPAQLRRLPGRCLDRRAAAGRAEHPTRGRGPALRLSDRVDARGRGGPRHRQGRAGDRQAAGRQDRHHQRQQGRLVRRLLARPGGRGVRRIRPAAVHGSARHRRHRGAADLDRDHAGRAEGQARARRSARRRGSASCG